MINFNKYKGIQVKVTKVKDIKFNNEHPANINEGHVVIGAVNVEESNKIQSLFVIHGHWRDQRYFHTSQVKEIEEHEGYDLLLTLNSIYKVQPHNDATPGIQEKYSLKIETDEQIRRDAHKFPKQIHLKNVRCNNQSQH